MWNLFKRMFSGSDNKTTSSPEINRPPIIQQDSIEPTLLILPLPKDESNRLVKSESEKFLEYTVNLSSMTCTCADYFKYRARFEVGDRRRACKHIRKLWKEHRLIKGSIYEAIIDDEYIQPNTYIIKPDTIILTHTPGKEWVNVFAKGPGKYSEEIGYNRYGYSLEENRWAYKLAPLSAIAILGFIKKIKFPMQEDRSFEHTYAKLNREQPISAEDRAAALELYELSNSILADDQVDEAEAQQLKDFCDSHPANLNSYPLNLLNAMLLRIYSNKKVSKAEREELRYFLNEIANIIQ